MYRPQYVPVRICPQCRRAPLGLYGMGPNGQPIETICETCRQENIRRSEAAARDHRQRNNGRRTPGPLCARCGRSRPAPGCTFCAECIAADAAFSTPSIHFEGNLFPPRPDTRAFCVQCNRNRAAYSRCRCHQCISAEQDSLPNTREDEDRPQHRYSPRDRPDVNMDEPVIYYPQQRICSICDRARAEPDMRPSPAPTAARDVVPRPAGFVALVTEMQTLTCTSGPRLAVGAGLDHRLRGTRSMTLRLPDIEGSVRRLGARHRLPDVDGSVRRLEARHHLHGGARSSTIRLPDVEARHRLGGRRHLGARNLSLGVRCSNWHEEKMKLGHRGRR
ncbi:hypothetical protein CKAH01_16501 [Colletotrichum kahawae]|uniref:Uncharacterized protein n=1 Tax=Colletotrichum kahawae TaxID=34407 RepID=A0AAD9YH51_COLKA|nr:hypothetical protein CKAH01_16501 [Colletotrichum kahawae]